MSRVLRWAVTVACLSSYSAPAVASDFRGFMTIFVGFPTVIFCSLVMGLLYAYKAAGFGREWSLRLLPLWGLAVPASLYFGFVIRAFSEDSRIFYVSTVLLAVLALVITLMLCLVYSPMSSARRDALAVAASWATLLLAALLTCVLLVDFVAIAGEGLTEWLIIGGYLLLLALIVRVHWTIAGIARISVSGAR